jgi:hypothetical protein
MAIVNLKDLSFENTSQYVGDTFQVPFDNGLVVDLVLEEVVLIMEKHLNPRMLRDSFAWHLRGPRTPHLPQNTYNITHETLGMLQLFIVPISAPEHGVEYEALFN